MKIPLNFSTFYQIVLKDKTPFSQIDAVNFLLIGDDSKSYLAISDDMCSNYVCGAKPISRDIVKKVLELPDNEVVERMRKLHIQKIPSTLKYISSLLSSNSFDLDPSETTEFNRLVIDAEPISFLSYLLLQAINCPRGSTHKLTDDEMEMLNTYSLSIKDAQQVSGYLSAIELQADNDAEDTPHESSKKDSETIIKKGNKILKNHGLVDWKDTSYGLSKGISAETTQILFKLPEDFEKLKSFCVNYEGINNKFINQKILESIVKGFSPSVAMYVIKTELDGWYFETGDFLNDLMPRRQSYGGILALIESPETISESFISDFEKTIEVIPRNRIITRKVSFHEGYFMKIHLVLLVGHTR